MHRRLTLFIIGYLNKHDQLLVRRLGLVVSRSAGPEAEGRRFDCPRFGSPPFSSKTVIYGHCLVTLPCTVNETVKWLTSLAHLNAEIVLAVTV